MEGLDILLGKVTVVEEMRSLDVALAVAPSSLHDFY